MNSQKAEGTNLVPQKIDVASLLLDGENPRVVEFGITSKSSQPEILKVLWEQLAVDEILYSMVSNGYWDFEPLVGITNGVTTTIIEGNRRLAAIKLIQGNKDADIELPAKIKEKITATLILSTQKVPVILVEKREDAWRFIGFKHVNGPAKWQSFAKAKYVAEIHQKFKIPLTEIAFQIGDTSNTVEKLYQGYMVLQQAKNEKIYDFELDVNANRIYFSHLYTGLQRQGIREFVKVVDADKADPHPIPVEKLPELKELLTWLFGYKPDKVKSVISSQNPDLKYLDEVLQNPTAVQTLRSTQDLYYAHEQSRRPSSLFEESLIEAKKHLQKAKTYVATGYQGEENILRLAGTIAENADSLYKELEAKYYAKLGVDQNKKRFTE